MNNINFKAKLTINPNLKKTLKTSDIDEITLTTKKFVENPKISSLLNEDEVILSGLKSNEKEGLSIQIGQQKIEIKTKGPIETTLVIGQILLYLCAKDNIHPLNGSIESILEASEKLIN